MSRKIAIVGNHAFPLDAGTGSQIVDVIRGFGEDVTILTRARGPVDTFIQHVCVVLNLRCLTYDASGGSSNIERDSMLVKDADELHGYLALEDFESGAATGTLWLVQKALSAGKPTFAYTAVDGRIIHVGSTAEEAS